MNKSHLRLGALVLFGIFALYGCVFAPLYQYLISDIVLQATLWLDLVDLLFQYTEFFGTAALFAFLVHAVYKNGVKGSSRMLILCGGAIAFKYLATVISISIINGSVNLVGGLTEYVFAFLLESALTFVAVYLAHRLVTPHTQRYAECRHASIVLGKPLQEHDGCFPFRRLFDRTNPVQRTLFISLVIVTAWRLAAFVISDFAYGLAITLADVPIMVLYWVILVLVPGFLSYLLSLALFRLAMRR